MSKKCIEIRNFTIEKEALYQYVKDKKSTLGGVKTPPNANRNSENINKYQENNQTIVNTFTNVNIKFGEDVIFSKLSNFEVRPFKVEKDVNLGGLTLSEDITFDSVEQAFHYFKLLSFEQSGVENLDKRKKDVLTLTDGVKLRNKTSKRYLREVPTNAIEQWDKRSYDVMKSLITMSINQNEDFKDLLIKTGGADLTHDVGKIDRWTYDFPKILTEIREALFNNAGDVHFQPVEDVTTPTYVMSIPGVENMSLLELKQAYLNYFVNHINNKRWAWKLVREGSIFNVVRVADGKKIKNDKQAKAIISKEFEKELVAINVDEKWFEFLNIFSDNVNTTNYTNVLAGHLQKAIKEYNEYLKEVEIRQMIAEIEAGENKPISEKIEYSGNLINEFKKFFGHELDGDTEIDLSGMEMYQQIDYREFADNVTTYMEKLNFHKPVFTVDVMPAGNVALTFNYKNWQEFEYFKQSVYSSDSVEDNTINQVFYQPSDSIDPDTVTSDRPITQDLTNSYATWVTSKERQLKEAKKLRRKLYLTASHKQAHIVSVNALIQTIEDDLKNVKTFKSFEQAILSEAEELLGMLSAIVYNHDPKDAAVTYEVQNIEARIKDLTDVYTIENASFTAITKNFATFTPEGRSKIGSLITDINTAYDEAITNIIYNSISNDSYFRNSLEFEKDPVKKRQIVNFLENLQDDLKTGRNLDITDIFSKYVLGSYDANSLLANILGVVKDRNFNTNVGATYIDHHNFKNIYDEIKNIKTANGEYLIDLFWQKDKFGVRSRNIVNPINGNWNRHFELLQGLKEFMNRDMTLKQHQTLNKSIVDKIKKDGFLIDVSKIKSVTDNKILQRNGELKQYFDDSTDDEKAAYEKQMRDLYGNTLFDLVVEQQVKQLIDYSNKIYNTYDFSFRYKENPIRFIRNFIEGNPYEKNSTIDDYLSIEFVSIFPNPNKDEFFNKDFTKVEQEFKNLGIEDKFNSFYVSMNHILNYSNRTFKSEGINRSPLEISGIEDRLSREVIKELSIFKKIPLYLRELFDILFSSYRQTTMAKYGEKPEFNTRHINFGKKEINRIKKILKSQTEAALLQRAKSLGLDVHDYDNENDREALINAIAVKEVDKSISLDTYQRVTLDLTTAQSINARRETIGFVELLKKYADKHQHIGLKTWLNSWGENNLLGNGFENSKNWINKITNKDIKVGKILTKRLTTAQETLKKFLEEKQKNANGEAFYYDDDTLGTFKYEMNKSGKYYKSNEAEHIEITQQEYEEVFSKYLQDEIDRLSEHYTIGDILGGVINNLQGFFLRLNFKGGFVNLHEGQHQIRMKASSERYGFGEDERRNAVRFLNSYGFYKFISNLIGKKLAQRLGNVTKILPKKLQYHLPGGHKIAQYEILTELGQRLGLLDNVLDHMTGGDGSFNIMSRATRVNEILGDFAVGIPEFYNQMTILLILLQNPKFALTDKDGNKRLLFDPKTNSFPFDPLTMKLLPEFREGEHAQSNIAMWENFTADAMGYNTQEVITTLYRQIKNSSQGNYSSTDKASVTSNLVGKAGTMFVRWSFSHLQNEFGEKHHDLGFFKNDQVGRTTLLWDKDPRVWAMYALLNQSSSLLLNGVAALNPLTIGITFKNIAGALVGLSYFWLKYKESQNGFMNELKGDFKSLLKTAGAIFKGKSSNIHWSLLRESIVRTVDTTVSKLTFDYAGLNDRVLDKLSGLDEKTWDNEVFTYDERRLLSEKIQGLANKLSAIVTLGGGAFIIYNLMLSMFGAGEDDDDLTKRDEMAEFMKFYLNTTSSIYDSAGSSLTPMYHIEAMTSNVFLSSLVGIYRKIKKHETEFENGRISKLEQYGLTTTEVVFPLIGIPNTLKKSLSDSEDVFGANRVYQNNMLSKTILNLGKTPEEKAKQQFKDYRNELRNTYKHKVYEYLKERNKKLSNNQANNMADKQIEIFARRAGYYKPRGITNIKYLEKFDIDKSQAKFEKLVNDTGKYNSDKRLLN